MHNPTRQGDAGAGPGTDPGAHDFTETRILLHAPSGKDAPMALRVLESAGIRAHVCPTFPELMAELARGTGAVLTVEEALNAGALAPLSRYVADQPTWSDIPIIVLTRHGADASGLIGAIELLGNLTLLERPVRTATLISAVRSALRARARQYQVREADQRKDEFIASLGHELRNPLAPIRTSMHILKRQYPADDNIMRVSELVERQVDYLARLVDDLLDVARITSGKVELQREPLLLADVMRHVLEICGPLLDSSGHRIDMTFPPEPVMLDADPVRLVQSLSNVLVNAIKYTLVPGTIVFRAEVDAGDAGTNDTVRFSVADSGIGLDEASLERIFDMFVQSKPASGRVQGGLGIGLSLAKKFTEMHGGTIRAGSSGVGKGSEFTLTLPIVVPAAASDRMHAARPAGGTAPEPANRRVLVVDDNRDGADTLLQLFEAYGFTGCAAYDGLQAVEQAAQMRPDVVMMDIGMPGIDGYEAARRIRRQPGCETTLMIALTGWGQDSARHLASDAGFDHHMVKPVDFESLRRFLDSARPGNTTAAGQYAG